MTEKKLDDIERSLARLAPKAIPPGLGQRVMASVLESRKNAVWTPRMRAVVGHGKGGAILASDWANGSKASTAPRTS